jgi:phosphoribosylamine--glycine ligase
MCYMLERWKKSTKLNGKFILQDFVKGIEGAVGGFFAAGQWVGPWLENFEHKKLMNDDKGPNTGEQGTVMKYVTDSLLAEECLLPLEGELYRQSYTGYIDVAVIIDPKGRVWPLEFTTRPGWPLFQIQQQLHPETAEWMKDLVEGRDTFKPSSKVAVGVVVSMPDYPYGHMTQKELSGYPIWGITDKNRKWIHPTEMMLGEAPHEVEGKIKTLPCFVSAGSNLLTVCGTGDGVEEAKERAYKIIDQLEVPNSPMYRTDIGDRVMRKLPELQKLGYATEWEL